MTQQLIARGKVTRGYIGATIQSLSPDLAGSLGLSSIKAAMVDQVTPGGPAERAGLRSGDVVTSVNGRPVTSSEDLTRQVALAQPGQAIELGVLRDGQTRQFDIRSGLRPPEASLAANGSGKGSGEDMGGGQAMLGMQLAPDPNGGLVVQGLSPNADAAQKGVQPGDVILRAGANVVASPSDLARAASAARAAGRKSVPLLVARGGQRFYVAVDLAAHGAG